MLYNNPEQLFFVLILVHFLGDFALQNDYVANFKAKYIKGEYNPHWYIVLTAHSSIHALLVLFITHSYSYAIFMLITHFIIDYIKSSTEFGKYKYSYQLDQALHLIVIGLIVLMEYSL